MLLMLEMESPERYRFIYSHKSNLPYGPKRSRIWWCPTTLSTVLPLHAAGDGRTCLIDKYISSYKPTLAALVNARQLPLSTPIANLHPTILVIAQTNSESKAAGAELDIMHNLGAFVNHLNAQNATRASVLSSMPNHDWTHFICHGSPEPFRLVTSTISML